MRVPWGHEGGLKCGMGRWEMGAAVDINVEAAARKGLVGCKIGHGCGCSTYPVVVALAAGAFCRGLSCWIRRLVKAARAGSDVGGGMGAGEGGRGGCRARTGGTTSGGGSAAGRA